MIVEKFPEAIQEYKFGIKCLHDSLRCMNYCICASVVEKNGYMVENLKYKINEYLKRAEYLKTVVEGTIVGSRLSIDQRKAKKEKVKEGGKDDESAKLESQLAQAIVTEKPNIKWEDVAGLELAKEELKGTVILPMLHPEFFEGKRQPWKGILMYGPPGTGKSYLAKAVASQADCTFMSVSSSDLVSKWQGEGAR